MRLRARTWWIVFGSLLIAGVAISAWLWATGQVTAARWVNISFDVVAAAWLALGLWTWREHPVVRRLGLIVAGTVAAAIAVNLFSMFGLDRWMIAAIGVWAMSVGFYLALHAARWLLGWGHPVLGVARTLLDEAMNARAANALLVLLFVIVPCIPLMIGSETRLSYRLQSFLTYSMIGVTTLLSLLTIVIAVTTITRELDDRQIFLTLSKPVGRGQYLLGKWLGLAVLNGLLVAVSGVGVYTYARVIAQQPAMNVEDVIEANEQVLTARRSVKPRPQDPNELQRVFEQRLERLREQDPLTYGQPGAPITQLEPEKRAAVQQQVVTAWYALRPLDTRTYVFHGLTPAKRRAAAVQLRMKPKAAGAPPDDMVYLRMRFNGYDDAVLDRKMADGKFHVIDIPTQLIDDAGTLRVEIYNIRRPDGQDPLTINFNPNDGMMMLYRVGSFETNLACAMGLLWLRLCFLGMLALAAGTFLGFHVAALLATLVAVAASGSGFLTESLQGYGAFPEPTTDLWDKLLFYPRTFWELLVHQGEGWKAVQTLIAMIGATFMKIIPDFGSYSGTQSLAFGLHIPLSHVGKAALHMGVLWTGLTGVIAWLIFRRRELARVQV